MKNISCMFDKQAEMQCLPVSVDENQDRIPDGSLKTKIDHRAHEISQRGGEHSGPSLASWLKAAREILSEDSERPQLPA